MPWPGTGASGSSGSGPRRVAVVYGAQQMRAVLRRLSAERHFYLSDIRWMTVFAL